MSPANDARVILYTGKGGVGKTSVAAAAALRCAERGARTIVLSTDTAHSLGDSLDHPLGPEPIEVAERLWAQECDIYYNLETYWGTVQSWVEALPDLARCQRSPGGRDRRAPRHGGSSPTCSGSPDTSSPATSTW